MPRAEQSDTQISLQLQRGQSDREIATIVESHRGDR